MYKSLHNYYKKYLVQYGETNWSTTTLIEKGIPLSVISNAKCISMSPTQINILTDHRAETSQAAWLEPKSSPEYTIYQQTSLNTGVQTYQQQTHQCSSAKTG